MSASRVSRLCWSKADSPGFPRWHGGLDNLWNRMRDEVPHVNRAPSEHLKEHFWFTTQPVEESERPADLLDTIRWIGSDRLMFATDYPHWDYDDPQRAFKIDLSGEDRKAIFRENGVALFRLNEK